MADTPKKLKDLKVADLKVELEKRGLEKNGLKADLIERLRVAVEEEGHDPDEYLFNDEEVKTTENEINEEKMNSTPEETKADEEDDQAVSNEELIFSEELTKNLTCVDQIEETEENDNVTDEFKEGMQENDNQENVEDAEDSLKIMIGDEDNLFEDENENKETGVNGVIHASPPRPETVPAKHPFTSKDTISLSSRSGKAPSDNSSMLVNPDECSLASHDSGMGRETEDKNGNEKDDPEKQVVAEVASDEKKEETQAEEKKKSVPSGSRNLWISGLSSTTRATDLKSVFSKHGKVVGAKVVTNAMTPGARCYGYVTMSTSDDAAKCIQHLNKTELHGRMITVERARGDSGSSKSAEAAKKNDDQKKDGDKKEEKKEDSKRDSHSASRKDSKDDKKPERHRITAPEGSSGSRREGERPGQSSSSSSRSGGSHHSGGRRDERRSHGQVLTFHQIRDQRRRELEKEEERRRRDRERRRREDDRLRREREEEEHRLRREREDLRRERERLEREKQELMKYERERQRAERERLEREKEDLERLRRQQQSSRVEETRRVTKRPVDERDPYYGDRKRGREDYGRSGGREQPGQGYSRSGYDRRPQEERSSGSRYESGRSGGNRDGRGDHRGSHGGSSRGHGNSSHGHGNSSHGHGNSSHGHGNSSHGHGNSSHGHGNSSHGHGDSSHGSHGHGSSHGHGGGGGGGGGGGNAWAGKSAPAFGVGGANNFSQVQGMDQDWQQRGGVSGNGGGMPQPARPLLNIAGVPLGVRPFAGIQQPFGGLAGQGGGQERYDQYRQPNNMMNQRRY